MELYGLVLGVLAIYRIAVFLTSEDGPWDLGLRLRRLAGQGVGGRLLDCFACASVWIAAPIACLVGEGHGERLLLWPALSGGALLLHRLLEARGLETDRRSPGPISFLEDPAVPEEHHGVLWGEESPDDPGERTESDPARAHARGGGPERLRPS